MLGSLNRMINKRSYVFVACVGIVVMAAFSLVMMRSVDAQEKQIFSRLTTSMKSDQRWFLDKTDLSFSDFLNAYYSSDHEHRLLAEVFLLAVLDVGEQKTWCSYQQFKTITIDETLHRFFKNPPQDLIRKRAATVIADYLSNRYPCMGIK